LRQRAALPLLVVLSALTAFGAGLSFMTHMHHRALWYVDQSRMAAFDAAYESLSDATVVPTSVLGIACTVTLLALYRRAVTVWLLGLTLVLQLAVVVTRIGTWGTWAQDVRDAGSVVLADGAPHPSYLLYMETNWMRITLVAGYAVLALVTATTAVTRAARPAAVVA
jgi:hypothetical protein